MRLCLIALAGLFALGCSLKRAPILPGSDGGMLDMDVVSPLDVPMPPGPDVPSVEIDAPSGCTASCAVGERCDGTACVCDSDLCAGDRTCIGSACVVCGGGGQACCPGVACRDGGSCGGDGLCPASRCDTIDDACCAGERCDGLTCRDGRCVALCGVEGAPCCPTGEECGMWTSCRLAWDLTNRCQSCGGAAEPCCRGACEGTMTCSGINLCF